MSKRKYKIKELKKRNGDIMATQIAPTPIVRGPEAVRILKEANRKPSQEAKQGAEKLAKMFEKMMK